MIGRHATPACQGGPVQSHATPDIDLALAVKRQVVGVFGDGDMRERAFGRQPAFDQPVGRVGLYDARVAAATGIARTDGDDDPEAGGDDVEAFSTVFADLHHVAAAAGASLLCGFYHLLDARQMVWQMAKVALGCRTPGFAIGVAFDQCLLGNFGLGDSRMTPSPTFGQAKPPCSKRL